MIKLSFMEIFPNFANMFSESSAAELSYVERVTMKGIHVHTLNHVAIVRIVFPIPFLTCNTLKADDFEMM